MAKRTFAFVAVFAALLSVTLSVQAENYDYYWSGSSDSYYLTTGNWNVGSPSGQQATVGLNTSGNNITAYMYNTNGVITLHNNNLGTSVYSVNIGTENGTGSASLFYDHNSTAYDFTITNGKTLSVYNGGTFTFAGAKRFVNNGTVNLNSGANFIVTEAELVIIDGANSVLNIKNGSTLTVTPTTYIGTANNGATVNQTGGEATYNGRLALGWGDHSGYYNLSGGTLTTTGEAGLWGGNGSGISEFTVSGGTANFNKTGNSFEIGLGGSNALANKFTLQGTGIVNVAETFAVKNSGILNIEGGTFNAPTITVDSASTFNMTGGALKTTAINMNGGTFTQGGGSLVYNGKLTVTGKAVLNGTIDMSKFLGTYNQTVDVIEATSITGSPSVSGDWTIANDGTKLTATYTGGSDNYYWTGTTSNDYYTGSNWSINGAQYSGAELDSRPPTFSKNCFILTSSGSVNLDWSTLGVASLTVGNGVGGTTGTAVVSRTGNIDVQTNLLVNKGGTVTSSGAITVTSRNNTPGTLTVDGGTFNANSTTDVTGNLIVNDGNYNANGATTINNGGTLTVNGGTFNANNTTNVAGTLNVQSGDYNATGTTNVNDGGTVTVSGGTFAATGATTVNANGSLTIDGGTFTFNASGQLKNNGTITISDDGALTVTSDANSFRIGDRGVGELNINGGTLTIAKPVYLGVGAAGETPSSGTINQTSGNVTFNDVLYLGWGAWSGTYNLSGNGVLTTSAAAGLWNANSSGISTFNVSGGQANFSSFDIGLHDSTGDNEVANVFNLYSGEVNTTGTFTVRKTGILNVAKTAQNAGGDGVFNANAIEINNKGILNLSSGTINLGSGGITSSGGTYTINLSDGTFGNKAGATGNGWSTSLTANIANGTTVTFAPAADKTITWNGALTGSGGGLTVDGEGTLELTAANTYSGVTTISAGTLKLSGIGTLAGNIVDNGTLEFAHTADLTGDNALTNAISGTGKVTKTGSGTLELKGANTYSGGTTISAGTLKLSNNNVLGTGNVMLENNSKLEFANSNGMDLTQVISGTGSVIKSGSGVLRVQSDNDYSGGTTIAEGAAIRWDAGANLGSGPITIESGADLRFSGGLTKTISNDISGPGILTKQGSSGEPTVTLDGNLSGFTGTLITNESNGDRSATIKLTGANSNLVNASSIVNNGTLDVSDYSGSTTMQLNKLSGAGIVNIGSKPIILNNAASADSTTFSGVINGTGAVTKTGAGTLKLTQAPAYTGSTTIEAGTLELPGNSTLHNLSGGTLGDNGQIAVQANLVVDGKLTLDNNAMSKFIGSITATEIEKTGNGTLKLYSAAANMISAESLVISSGRVDIKEYFKGQIEVKSGGTISPGNSVGTLEIVPLGEETYGGGFILNEEGSKLLMEIGGETPDKNDKLIVDGPLSIGSGIIYLALADENTLTTGDSFEAQIIAGNESTDYLNAITKAVVPGWPFANVTVTKSGNVYSIRGIYEPNAVPEPSTWALLILGAAGMLYWRKRKNNK